MSSFEGENFNEISPRVTFLEVLKYALFFRSDNCVPSLKGAAFLIYEVQWDNILVDLDESFHTF